MASRPTPFSIAFCGLIVLHYKDADLKESSGRESFSPLYQSLTLNDNENNDIHNVTCEKNENDEEDDTSDKMTNTAIKRKTKRQHQESVESFLQEILFHQGRIDADNRPVTEAAHDKSNKVLPQWAYTTDSSICEFVLALWNRVVGGGLSQDGEGKQIVSSYLEWLR